MPPKTRMTSDQVAAVRSARRVVWERRTGLKLRTQDEQREMIGDRKLSSVLPRMRNWWANGLRRG